MTAAAGSSLAEVALAFCREVLGWRMAVDRKYGEQNRDPLGKPSNVWSPYVFDYDGRHPQFHYTNPTAVVEAAGDWMKNCADPVAAKQAFKQALMAWLDSRDTSTLNFCHHAMSGCVKAARRMKIMASKAPAQPTGDEVTVGSPSADYVLPAPNKGSA